MDDDDRGLLNKEVGITKKKEKKNNKKTINHIIKRIITVILECFLSALKGYVRIVSKWAMSDAL